MFIQNTREWGTLKIPARFACTKAVEFKVIVGRGELSEAMNCANVKAVQRGNVRSGNVTEKKNKNKCDEVYPR